MTSDDMVIVAAGACLSCHCVVANLQLTVRVLERSTLWKNMGLRWGLLRRALTYITTDIFWACLGAVVPHRVAKRNGNSIQWEFNWCANYSFNFLLNRCADTAGKQPELHNMFLCPSSLSYPDGLLT